MCLVAEPLHDFSLYNNLKMCKSVIYMRLFPDKPGKALNTTCIGTHAEISSIWLAYLCPYYSDRSLITSRFIWTFGTHNMMNYLLSNCTLPALYVYLATDSVHMTTLHIIYFGQYHSSALGQSRGLITLYSIYSMLR